jgi:SagB-type dehydrogenase family enzyme
LEAGHLAQNVFLQATARDLGTMMVVVFNETKVQSLLSSPAPLLIMPIGKPLDGYAFEKPKFDGWLPYPNFTGEIALEKAIAMRRSVREYAPGNLTISQVSQLLWAAQGVKGLEKAFRTVPSIGGVYSVEIFVAVGNVSGMAQGVYLYEPENHSLKKVADGDIREELFIASGGKWYTSYDWVKQGRICIVPTVVYNRCVQVFGQIGERIARFQAGMAAQNIALEATAIGLGTVTVGAFWDDVVQGALHVTTDYAPMYLMPVGIRPMPQE